MAGIVAAPTTPVFLDGRTITAAQLTTIGTHAAALFTRAQGGFRTRKPVLQVYNNSGIGIPATTNYTVGWLGASFNTDGMWSAASPAQVVVNTPGWYRLALQVHWDSTPNGIRSCKIVVNGTDPSASSVATANRYPCAGEGTVVFCQCVTKLAAGALIYATLYTTTASGIISTYSGSYMSAEWIAPP